MCPSLKEKKIQNKTETTDSSAGTNFDCSTEVLLKTIMVFISVSPNTNQKRAARILFDDGSQKSYITSSMAKSIKSIPFGHEYVRNILFDGSRTECEKLNNHKINFSGLDGIESMTMVLRERTILGGNISRIPKGVWLDELKKKGIIVNDIVRNNKDSVEIDIVIGSDYWGLVMKGNKETLSCGLTANESMFGWTLSGVIPKQSQADNTISMFLTEENVNKLWSLDIIGIKDPIEKLSQIQEEMAAKKIFKETVKRNKEGRYEVKLPWISEERNIPNNKKIAAHRLTSATKKLNINNRFSTYDDIFKTWIKEEFIEKIDTSKENEENCHYLPHHPVFKDSITTPVRPVFDASCKFGRNPSLNDCLYKGPNCIELLPAVLMRFRLKKVGAISVIRKAFQMIEVEKQDQEYLRFLWWEDATQTKMITLRHRRVVFGLVCSPYLLAAVLETHLNNVPESRMEIATEVLKSIYVDNCVTSFNSHEDYDEFKKVSCEILAEAKMELRQWESSFREGDLHKEEETETKVLGMIWNKKEDNLSIQIPKIEFSEELTKRNIASILHKFFDPIGFTCPALLQPKIMLQQAWKNNISWDCGLPRAWNEKFTNWCEEAHLLKEIKIPRLCQLPDSSNKQLHTFTDASQNAFATVVFLRTKHKEKVKVQLMQSKSRVSPIGTPTIPRLEILGCLIGSRLSTSVIEAMDFKDISKYFWCDSTTAIAWIQRNNEWGTFVGNRVKRFLQDTDANQWRHIPGALNPADLPSRGCSPKELLLSKWWEGPEWLRLSSDKWPNKKEMEFNKEEVNSEKKKKAIISMFTVDMQSWFKTKFNSYSSQVRTMAWIKRFCHNAKNPNTKKSQTYLKFQELRDAEVDIVRIIQEETKLSLKEEKQIKKHMSPSLIKEKGILRLRTPITRRMDHVGFRYPYLLPRTHPLVRDLIMEAHIQYCHAGTQFLMGKLREKFWITQTRKTISSVIHQCKRCQRFSTKKMEVAAAPLPKKRVTSGEIFDTTGVDLFGYLTLKDNTKVWVVLYTCAVYRAIHLDIVNSTSTDAFIESLKKFIYGFGRPSNMMSDNGTNFVGTANLFKVIDKTELEKECSVQKIQWNFNPPAAPWWGGFWERLVRSVKDPLRKMLGKSIVNFEELQMLLLEITSVVNERPLTTVTEDPQDLDPLTPAMFLRGTKNATFPEEEITNKTLQKEWQRIKDLKERLQARFRREYLAQLVEHKKSRKPSIIAVGDIVLVEKENKKRYQWPMGRVEEIIPSSDGEIRVAKIRTRTGCINRALDRLYPLEMSNSSSTPMVTDLIKDTKNRTSIDESKMNELEKEELNKEELTTRSGRRINKPQKYGFWNR